MKLSGNALAVLVVGLLLAAALYVASHHVGGVLVVLAITAVATVVFMKLQARYDAAAERLRASDDGDGRENH